MSKLRIGIIGAGWIIQNAYIPLLLKLNNVMIVAIYDTNMERAYKVSKEFGIEHVCRQIDEFYLLGLNAAIIATPNYTHASYSLEMLRHKISVLCEKPVALHAEEVEEIIRAEKDYGVIYMPGFVNRLRHDVQKVLSIIRSGEIGDLEKINAKWLRRQGVPRPGTWFTNRELSGGGVLIDLGSHIIDICLLALKDKFAMNYELKTSKFQGNSDTGFANWFKADYFSEYVADVEDTACAIIQYSDGTILNVSLCWLAPIKGDCTYFELIGTKGSIKLKTLFGFSDERLWKEDTLSVRIGEQLHKEKLDGSNSTYMAFEKMLKLFVDALEGEKAFMGSFDALRTVSMIEKLYSVENSVPLYDKKEILEGI